jgi:TolB-like protein
MKNLLLALIIFFPLSVYANTYDDMAKDLMKKIPAKEKTKVIAVMPFSSSKEFSSDAEIATEEMTKALVDAGANVSERSQIDKMLKEQELQQVGILTNENAGEVGQGLGAKYVILGSISKIDKYGEEGNIGLRVNVKLVVSSNYKVLAVASGEAAAGDASARYKRKAPRKAVEYPQFLELYGGMTFHKYQGEYDELFGSNDGEIEDKVNPGFSAGLRLVRQNDGFYTSGWEFLYSTRQFEDDAINTRFDIYQVSWIPTIRLPLWIYYPALPDYTSIHVGYAFGFGINRVTYFDGIEKESSKGFGFCSSAIIGLRIGLSESISFITDFRYTPHALNAFMRSQDVNDDDVTVKEDLTGPSVYIGLSLTP